MHNVDPALITTRIIENKPKHNVIYSAAAGLDGRIYLGLSAEMDAPGAFGQVICYDPDADCFQDIVDFADIVRYPAGSLRHPHSKIHTAICVGRDGKIYAATHMTAPPAGEDFYHYWHVSNDKERSFPGSHLIMYDPGTGKVEDLGTIAPGCGCRWLGHNPDRDELYMTTFLTAHFVVVKLRTGEVKDLGRISQYDFMGPCYSSSGYVFTTDCQGLLLRYDPVSETLQRLPVRIPNAPWRDHDGNGVFHFVPGPDKLKLYGVSAIGQRVFEYDPSVGTHGQIRDYGTLYDEDRMEEFSVNIPLPRTICTSPDGKIYIGTKNYISGVPGSTIVSIDIASGEKTYYGTMKVDGFARVNTPVACTADQRGNVYFTGEQPGKQSPLQMIIFNPNGVKRGVPAHYREKYPFRGDDPLAANSGIYAYYYSSRENNSVFVTRGSFYAQELGFRGKVPLIPRLECGITALARLSPRVVLGATSGQRSHLFAYLPYSKRFLRLPPIGDGAQSCRCMVGNGAGEAFFATGPAAGGGHLYRYAADAPRDLYYASIDDIDRGEFRLQDRPVPEAVAAFEDLGCIGEGEGIAALALDGQTGTLYGLTTPGGIFFRRDPASGVISRHDLLGEYFVKRNVIPPALVCAAGKVYFSGKFGRIVCYDPAADSFRLTAMKIPVSAGREYLNCASALAVAGEMVYGGTYADGYLFAFDPHSETLRALGKPCSENSIRAITVGADGIVWGLSGSASELVHLFAWNPATGESRDCGLMRAKMPKTWVVHRAGCLLTGADGEIYVGEEDALSHLMIYFPPLRW